MSVLQESPARGRTRRIAPRYVVHAGRAVPVLVAAQFFTAGLALFQDSSFWELHAGLGFLVAVPLSILCGAALTVRSIRPLRWWAGLLALLYVLQIVYIAAGQELGSGLLQSMHPFNGALLLAAALVIVAKIERSHQE